MLQRHIDGNPNIPGIRIDVAERVFQALEITPACPHDSMCEYESVFNYGELFDPTTRDAMDLARSAQRTCSSYD